METYEDLHNLLLACISGASFRRRELIPFFRPGGRSCIARFNPQRGFGISRGSGYRFYCYLLNVCCG